MVSLTHQATAVLHALLDRPADPGAAGLRLRRSGTDIVATPARGPEPGDVVVGEVGASLFVGPADAAYLGDRALDATITTEGRVRFFLAAEERR